MFENQKPTDLLSQKVNELIQKYLDALAQIEALRNEIVTIKSQNETLNLQLTKVEDEFLEKGMTEEELIKQIENVLVK